MLLMCNHFNEYPTHSYVLFIVVNLIVDDVDAVIDDTMLLWCNRCLVCLLLLFILLLRKCMNSAVYTDIQLYTSACLTFLYVFAFVKKIHKRRKPY